MLVAVVLLLGGAGYVRSLRAERTGLTKQLATETSQRQHAEQMLAPFQAAALKAFPDEDHIAALEKLTTRVEQLATGLAAQRATDLNTLLENCYTEIVRASWSLDDLAHASTSSVTNDFPQVSACSRLADNSELPTWIRSRVVLYVSELGGVEVWHRMLSQQCATTGVAEGNVGNARDRATRMLAISSEVKDLLGNQLLTRGRQLPVEEHTSLDGQHSLSVTCPAPESK